ncbi:MAG: hypothetical protein R2795_21040 [Saprospiraceae bacterium]
MGLMVRFTRAALAPTGNWQHSGKLWYGLQRLAYNGDPTFEMLAVRAKTNGWK